MHNLFSKIKNVTLIYWEAWTAVGEVGGWYRTCHFVLTLFSENHILVREMSGKIREAALLYEPCNGVMRA